MDMAEFRSRRATERQKAGKTNGPKRAAFYFDLASPFTYLAAERVERGFAEVEWIPACGTTLRTGAAEQEADRRAADRRAAALRLPIVWPARWPKEVRPAMRAATFAAEQGRGAIFVLAACRLAWAGGFDLADPDVVVEAAAAAGLPTQDVLAAARDASRDERIAEAGRRIREAGADRLPALVVARTVFAGEDRVAEAAALARRPESA